MQSNTFDINNENTIARNKIFLRHKRCTSMNDASKITNYNNQCKQSTSEFIPCDNETNEIKFNNYN